MSDVEDPFRYVDGLLQVAKALSAAGRLDQARALAQVAAPLVHQFASDTWKDWANRLLAEIEREPTEQVAAVEAPVPRAPVEAAAPPAPLTRRAVAELLMGPRWAEALPALQQLDPDTFRHVPELLLRDR